MNGKKVQKEKTFLYDVILILLLPGTKYRSFVTRKVNVPIVVPQDLFIIIGTSSFTSDNGIRTDLDKGRHRRGRILDTGRVYDGGPTVPRRGHHLPIDWGNV